MLVNLVKIKLDSIPVHKTLINAFFNFYSITYENTTKTEINY